MTKLWPCTITIGNHLYNVMMYSVKDLAPRPSTAERRPVLQYGPPPKSLDIETMLGKQATRDQELMALLKTIAKGDPSTDDFENFEAYIDAARPARPARACVVNVRKSRATDKLALPDISAIVLEFIGGSGDRFRFPKYSILEYLPEGHVIACFLIVRKGSNRESKPYIPKLDYYQPITIRLCTDRSGRLDLLSKVVALPDEARKYMNDIMDNMTRAEYVLLSMRMPVQGTMHNK
jgi:hypothetical protein